MVNLNQNIELSAAELKDECTISSYTFEELAKRKDLTAIACGHKFSRIAITAWFAKEATCPVCRTGVDKQKLVHVALPIHKVANNKLQNSPVQSSKDIKSDKVKDINGALSEEEALAAVLAISTLKTNQNSSNSLQSVPSITDKALISSNNDQFSLMKSSPASSNSNASNNSSSSSAGVNNASHAASGFLELVAEQQAQLKEGRLARQRMLAEMATLKGLTHIELKDNNFTTLQGLETLTELRSLTLGWCMSLKDEGLAPLIGHKRLQELTLTGGYDGLTSGSGSIFCSNSWFKKIAIYAVQLILQA